MLVIAWLFFVFYAFFTLVLVRKFTFKSINKYELLFLLLSLSITGVSAGIIWGGLFR
ncbi:MULTISPECIES: hypothetical protein [unclassified Paenibacillus]|uniref:hypothetical protein n=1 Tax=unclassified Paenibacillus TaxID=185978 RepID=UPI00089AD4DD|nr:MULTISPECIES: hypothetical protein [unclassified Paenibacillus]SDW57240.1 hypothetical protein SAMN05518848_102223 [Paenibacillus sp. PDC88]